MAAERSDTLIGDEVVRTLGAEGRFSQVLVQVSEGHVTLSGDVPDARRPGGRWRPRWPPSKAYAAYAATSTSTAAAIPSARAAVRCATTRTAMMPRTAAPPARTGTAEPRRQRLT